MHCHCALTAERERSSFSDKFMESLFFKNILKKDVFPIGGFFGLYAQEGSRDSHPPYDFIAEKYTELIKNCGINFVVFHLNSVETDSGKRVLQLYDRYGIGYFITDNRIIVELKKQRLSYKLLTEKIKKYTDEYKNAPGYLGLYVWDEPDLQDMAWQSDVCRAFYAAGQDGVHPYINLLPSNGDRCFNSDGTYCDFEEYVTAYLKECKLSFLSYDHYLYITGLRQRATIGDLKFCEDLNTASVLSKRYGVPFWVHIACGGQWGEKNVINEYYPNRAQFMLSIHLAMAFGAKGIQYFPLLQPKQFYAPAQNSKVNGLIGYNGRPNKWYNYARAVNTFLSAHSRIFCLAEHEGVAFLGGSAVPATSRGVAIDQNRYGCVEYMEADHAVIGLFSFEGKPMYYIVNNSVKENGEVCIRFDRDYRFRVLSLKGEKELSADKKSRCVAMRLKPAECSVLLAL